MTYVLHQGVFVPLCEGGCFELMFRWKTSSTERVILMMFPKLRSLKYLRKSILDGQVITEGSPHVYLLICAKTLVTPFLFCLLKLTSVV